MTDTTTAVCPICSITFTPPTARAVYCSKPCGIRGSSLLTRAKAYDAGVARITVEVLEEAMRCREAMQTNADARAEAQLLADIAAEEREEGLHRRYHRAVLRQEREWMRRWGEGNARRKTEDPDRWAHISTFSVPMPSDTFRFPEGFTFH